MVGLVGGGAEVPQIAAAVIRAGIDGFELAALDPALHHAVWLLVRLPRAAKFDDFPAALRALGLPIHKPPTLFDLTAAVSAQVDACRPRTDVSELAHAAACEVLTTAVGGAADNLFGTTPAEVQHAVSRFDTPARFAGLARQFFARFTAKHLNFYLDREVGRHLGDRKRFPTLAAHAAFRQSLADHCHLAAEVVEKIAADWYSKKQFETSGNISKESAVWFARHVLEKLTKVLKREVP